jgi:putative flippase GtrA
LSSRNPRALISQLLSTRAVRFIGVGCAATITDFFVFNLLLAGVPDPTWGRVVIVNTSAFVCATMVSYLLNSRLTFRAPIDQASFARYIAVAIVGAVIYDGVLVGLMHAADAESVMALNLVKLLAIGLSAAWNFVGFSLFVFRDSTEPATAQSEARL